MLKLQKTRIMKSFHRNVATGYDIKNEGVALVYVNENGEGKVKPSSGAPNEKFAGVSLSQVQVPTQLTGVENFLVAGTTTIKLARTNLVAGQITVKSGNTTLVLAANAAAGQFAVNTLIGEVTIDSSNAGTAISPVEISVVYKYVPSVQEAINAQGYGPAGGIHSASYYSVVGVITEGDVSTDQFDVTDDWSATTGPVYLGPNGLFTLKAGGTELKGCNIIGAPSAPNGSFFGAFITLNFGPYSG
jgi:hypothetical protein